MSRDFFYVNSYAVQARVRQVVAESKQRTETMKAEQPVSELSAKIVSTTPRDKD